MQRSEGELAATIEKLLPRIAHIQIADNPGRNEPGTGEINYDFLFRRIDEIGYDGWIGCEYKPKTTTAEGLGWLARAAVRLILRQTQRRTDMAKVGFIGLGIMGRPMAGHLIDAGHELSLFNRSAVAAGSGQSRERRANQRRKSPSAPTPSSSWCRTRRTSRPCCSARTASPTGLSPGKIGHRHELDLAGRHEGFRQADRGPRLRVSRRAGVRRRGRRQAGVAVHHVRRLAGDVRQGQAATGKDGQEHHPGRRQRRGPDLQGRQPDRRRADDRGGRRGARVRLARGRRSGEGAPGAHGRPCRPRAFSNCMASA